MSFLRRFRLPIAAVLCVLALAGAAFADNSSVTTAVTTALSGVQTDVMSIIAAVLPYALAIVGAVLVVTIGVKVFKKISGR